MHFPWNSSLTSVTQKNIPSSVVIYYYAWYVFLYNRRYTTKEGPWKPTFPGPRLLYVPNEQVIGLKWIWPYKSFDCEFNVNKILFSSIRYYSLFVFSWLILFFHFLLYFACSHVRGHSITTWAKRGGWGVGDK